jgi:hypothetical protein
MTRETCASMEGYRDNLSSYCGNTTLSLCTAIAVWYLYKDCSVL